MNQSYRFLIILSLFLDEQSTSMSLEDFRGMPDWKKGRDNGYWRATNKNWIEEAKSGIKICLQTDKSLVLEEPCYYFWLR